MDQAQPQFCSHILWPHTPKLTYPPLRQLSVIASEQKQVCRMDNCTSGDKVSLVFKIKWSIARPKFPFKVYLCYADAESRQHASLWPATPLDHSSSRTITLQENDELHTSVYTGKLARPTAPNKSRLTFTFKYRIADDAVWQWINAPDGNGLERGQIIFQSSLQWL